MQCQDETLRPFPGTTLFTRCWRPAGKTSRAVFVITHGFGEHCGRYENLVGELLAHDLVVYSFDNPGFGRSSGRRGHVFSWAEYRDSLGFFLAHVRQSEGDKPLFLYGHSMGGLIVADYVLTHPEGLTGVILSGPALTQGAVSPVLVAVSRFLSVIWPTCTLDTKLDATAISKDPKVVAAYCADPLVHSRASARMGTEMAKAIAFVKENAPAFSPPLLIVHGASDRLVDPQTSREFFEKAGSADKTRLDYASCYHEPHNEVEWRKPVSDILSWVEKRIP
ncbi:MAG: lysophospholipase [Thermodesulfobacteriota bacterium]